MKPPKDAVSQSWWVFIRRNRSLFVGMLSYAAVPPIVDFIFCIGPPWPHRGGVVAFSSVTAYIVAISVYIHFAHGIASNTKNEHLRARLSQFMVLSIMTSVIYIAMCAGFLYDAPDVRHQVAGGFYLRPEIIELMKNDRTLTIEICLESAEWNPERIWIPWTVRLINAVFLLAWLGFYGLLGCIISTFAVYLQDSYTIGNRIAPPTTPLGNDDI